MSVKNKAEEKSMDVHTRLHYAEELKLRQKLVQAEMLELKRQELMQPATYGDMELARLNSVSNLCMLLAVIFLIPIMTGGGFGLILFSIIFLGLGVISDIWVKKLKLLMRRD